MDSRSKILTLDAALALAPARPLVLAAGLFDILRAAHIRELTDLRRRTSAGSLMAIVLPEPDALLPQLARAELAAALRMIDYVVAATDADIDSLTTVLEPTVVVRAEEADRARVHQLIEHVHSRQAR